MTVASVNANGDFRVGDVLSRAWSILSGNIGFFIAVPVVLLVCYVMLGAVLGFLFGAVFAAVGRGSPWVAGVAGIVTIVGMLCLNMIGQGVLLLGAFQRLRGEPLRPAEALQRVLKRFLPLAGLSILWSLALVAAVIFSSFVFWALALALKWFAFVLVPVIAVPPFMLLVMWLVAVPACVVESHGPVSSMSRSAALTKGFRWKITGIVLLILAATALARLLQSVVAMASSAAEIIFILVWFVAWIAYLDCIVIMTYHDLRVAKEGIDTAQIASVFD